MASAISNSLSAYSNSKSYSPSFKVGAEFLERNIATPMANTVDTASRISGVQHGVRWFLQRNDSSNSNNSNPTSGEKEKTPTPSNNKRRRDSEGAETAAPPVHRARGLSDISQTESLPPYDDRRSPAYEENYTSPYASSSPQQPSQSSQTPIQQSWSTRVAIHTSGLGVAMSDESLRSLKYCLTWLKWANSHLNHILTSLQSVLEEWERSQRQQQEQEHHQTFKEEEGSMEGVESTAAGAPAASPAEPQPRDQAAIANHLQALKNECVKTLKTALDVVSKYAGGALPENARWIVRCHLTSLPARFRSASSANSRAGSVSGSSVANGELGASGLDAVGGLGTHATTKDEEAQTASQPEAVTGAQRVVVLAKEGLDMMAQVSAVVDGTIVSAEEWCERLGRRRNNNNGNGAGPAAEKEGANGGMNNGDDLIDLNAGGAVVTSPTVPTATAAMTAITIDPEKAQAIAAQGLNLNMQQVQEAHGLAAAASRRQQDIVPREAVEAVESVEEH